MGSGFAVDWNPVPKKNQMLSRYRMHIELSCEFGSEWEPWRVWVESLLHYITWSWDVCVIMYTLVWLVHFVIDYGVGEIWIPGVDVHLWYVYDIIVCEPILIVYDLFIILMYSHPFLCCCVCAPIEYRLLGIREVAWGWRRCCASLVSCRSIL